MAQGLVATVTLLKVSTRALAESNTHYGCLNSDSPSCWQSATLAACICVCAFVYVSMCQHMTLTVPKYICFSASCQSEGTFFCTPTVACGTVIFVNATLVTFCKSPERSGPNKHRHGWFHLFFTLFSGHSEWNPDPKAVFKLHQIRKWIRSQFRKWLNALAEPFAKATTYGETMGKHIKTPQKLPWKLKHFYTTTVLHLQK